MPSKKKKYNARFPAGRIKKIMQTDDEVGKVAQAVPVIISRTLELFVESLLTKAQEITSAKNAKTLSPSHMKQCILSESRFDFLKELVASLPDVSCDYEENNLVVTMSPPPGNSSSSSDEVTSASSYQVEKVSEPVASTRNKDHSAVTIVKEEPATSTGGVSANFYRECTENSISCEQSTVLSRQGTDDEIDEDYDTT